MPLQPPATFYSLQQLPGGFPDTQSGEDDVILEVSRETLPQPLAWQGRGSPPLLAYGISPSREQEEAMLSAGVSMPGGGGWGPPAQSFVAHAPVGFPMDPAKLATPPVQVSMKTSASLLSFHCYNFKNEILGISINCSSCCWKDDGEFHDLPGPLIHVLAWE